MSPHVAHRADRGVEERIGQLGRASAHRRRTEEPAARATQVARHQVEHLQQPVHRRALAAHVPAGPHVRDRGGRLGERPGRTPDVVGVEPGHAGHARRVERCDELAQTLDVARVLAEDILVPSADAVDLVEHRGEEVEIGVGADLEEVAEPELHRPDAPRVHERDLATALADAADRLDRVRDRHRGQVTAARVGAETEEEVGVVQVGHGERGLGAEHRVHRRELVRQVLREAAEEPARLHLRPERVDGRDAGRRVRQRIAPVAADRLGAVTLTEIAEPRADVADARRPR